MHPGSGNRDGTLLNALLHHAPQLAHVPRAGIVHRLDKDTSGLLVVAKTHRGADRLSCASCRRAPSSANTSRSATGDIARGGTVDAPIGRHPTRRTTMAVVATGKPARTHYEVVERFGTATLLRAAWKRAAPTRSACISPRSVIRSSAIRRTAAKARSLSRGRHCTRFVLGSCIR